MPRTKFISITITPRLSVFKMRSIDWSASTKRVFLRHYSHQLYEGDISSSRFRAVSFGLTLQPLFWLSRTYLMRDAGETGPRGYVAFSASTIPWLHDNKYPSYSHTIADRLCLLNPTRGTFPFTASGLSAEYLHKLPLSCTCVRRS